MGKSRHTLGIVGIMGICAVRKVWLPVGVKVKEGTADTQNKEEEKECINYSSDSYSELLFKN